MGSLLGPLFDNFYMCELENKVMSDKTIVPHIYCRYVDDIFVLSFDCWQDENSLETFRNYYLKVTILMQLLI